SASQAQDKAQSLEERVRHPLSFLEDKRQGVMCFAASEDDMVALEYQSEIFDLFATSALEQFLFLARSDGRVYQYSDWSPDGSGPVFEPINTSLVAFVKCYCMEQSIEYRLRAQTVGQKRDACFQYAAAEALETELSSFI